MIILSGETEALAKRLAAAQRLSIEETVKQALEEKARAVPELQWRRDNSPAAIAKREANIDRIVAEIAASRSSIRVLRKRSWTILTAYDGRR